MAKQSKFDADKLRSLIEQGKKANEIIDALGISKANLKAHHQKLMLLDKKFYEIEGMNEKMAGAPKVGKGGFKLSLEKMQEYGFSDGDAFKVSVEKGKIITLTKI